MTSAASPRPNRRHGLQQAQNGERARGRGGKGGRSPPRTRPANTGRCRAPGRELERAARAHVPMLFWPTIGAAITAWHWFRWARCPARWTSTGSTSSRRCGDEPDPVFTAMRRGGPGPCPLQRVWARAGFFMSKQPVVSSQDRESSQLSDERNDFKFFYQKVQSVLAESTSAAAGCSFS